MIDKTEIECRFRRSVDSYEDNATVQKWIVQRLVELLQEYLILPGPWKSGVAPDSYPKKSTGFGRISNFG